MQYSRQQVSSFVDQGLNLPESLEVSAFVQTPFCTLSILAWVFGSSHGPRFTTFVEPWMAILVESRISCSRSWSNLMDLALLLIALNLAASCLLRLPWPVCLSVALELGALGCLLLCDPSGCVLPATQRLEGAISEVPCPALGRPSHCKLEAARENVPRDTEDLDDVEALEDVREMDDPLEGTRRIGLDVVDALDPDDVREKDDPLEGVRRKGCCWDDPLEVVRRKGCCCAASPDSEVDSRRGFFDDSGGVGNNVDDSVPREACVQLSGSACCITLPSIWLAIRNTSKSPLVLDIVS